VCHEQITKQAKSVLKDISMGGAGVGLARDRDDNLYEWGLNHITPLEKQASYICQGGESFLILEKKETK
jgi:hypothetical protein